ncbi:MAG TPA: flagellar biosynthesis anti-sigma factor FlgM [Burkholderiales bacterium]
MKINGNSDPLRVERPGTPAAGGAKQANKAGAGPATDQVQLSGLSEQLAKLADEQSTAVYDQGRVDSIKDAIRRGDFRVDSDVVADRLLQSVQQLVAKQA